MMPHWCDDSPGARTRRLSGLPARICWLGYGDRARFGLKINGLVRAGVIKAPIVIGRDHLDTAPLRRRTRNGRDARRQRRDCRLPVLNALLNASAGATWVSVHHGGGSHRLFASRGMVVVADGSTEATSGLNAC